MYNSLVIDNKFVMTLFYIFYDAQSQRGKGSPSPLALLLFEIIWNAEDQKNELDKPDQKSRPIRLNRIVKAFSPRPNLETSRPFKCSRTIWTRSGIVDRFRELVTISKI